MCVDRLPVVCVVAVKVAPAVGEGANHRWEEQAGAAARPVKSQIPRVSGLRQLHTFPTLLSDTVATCLSGHGSPRLAKVSPTGSPTRCPVPGDVLDLVPSGCSQLAALGYSGDDLGRR